MLMCKAIFAEYGLPKKIISDLGGNFISDLFKTFCKSLNIEEAFSSSYHHQSSMKFVKCTLKKCFYTKGDPYIALLQIHITPLGLGLPSLASILFNHPIRDIMPIISRLLIGVNNDEHYEALVNRQTKDAKNEGTPHYVSVPTGSAVAAQHEDGGLW